MDDVTVALNPAQVTEIVDCEALSGGLRAKVAAAAGESFDAAAPKLTCARCGFAGVTSRTRVEHAAMHLQHDSGAQDVDVTEAVLAAMFAPAAA